MKHHTLFFRELGKMLENLSSAAVVIGLNECTVINHSYHVISLL